LEDLTVFAMETQVAIIYVHHHSKGNQSEKKSLDRSSGAGTWSRDPDAVLDLAEHQDSIKEAPTYTAEITARDFSLRFSIRKFVNVLEN
jgi:RecA-family ATPase